MKTNEWLWFGPYGELEYLESKEYKKGPWKYVGLEEAEDGIFYDIVRNTKTDEYRFTEI